MRDSEPAPDARDPRAEAMAGAGAGLRLRLWLACIAGALIGAAAVLWIASSLAPADALFDPRVLGVWPWTAAAACVVFGIAIAIWLDYGIVIHLRGVLRALESRDPSELRGLPSASGWGELSALTDRVQDLIEHERSSDRVVAELDEVRQRLKALRVSIDLHTSGEPWSPPTALIGPTVPVIESLQKRFDADEEARLAIRRAALEAREDILHAVDDARESAEQAERGFVEAGALIATIREVQRLGQEFEGELASARRATAPADAPPGVREAAAEAIDALVVASSESVEHLAGGLLKIQAIGEQVQQLGNRATLIALHVALDREGHATGAPEEPADAGGEGVLAPQLRELAREVRAVTERTTELSREIDRDVEVAVERMHGIREQVAERLDRLPATAAPGHEPVVPLVAPRLLERMRGLIEESAVQTERMVAAGERASRVAERLIHRLDEHALVMEMLATSVGATAAELSERAEATADSAVPRPPTLRLLGREDGSAASSTEDEA